MGDVADQAALHSLLARIRDLGIPILLVSRLHPAEHRLDAQGQPIEGTGKKYDSNGRLALLLAQRTSPIFSRPSAGEWFFEVN